MANRSVYISGPYTGTKGEEYENTMNAAEAAAFYLKQGFFVFCPHTMTRTIARNFNQGGEITYDGWLENDIYFLEKCDIVAFLPGWENSKGAWVEHLVACALGKEIEYIKNSEQGGRYGKGEGS